MPTIVSKTRECYMQLKSFAHTKMSQLRRINTPSTVDVEPGLDGADEHMSKLQRVTAVVNKSERMSSVDNHSFATQSDKLDVVEKSKASKNISKSAVSRCRKCVVISLSVVSVIAIAVAFALAYVLGSRKSYMRAIDPHSPVYPLAVRTPYLSAWLPGNFAHDITKAQPQFWNGEKLTWNVMARVAPEGDASQVKTYMLMGFPQAGVKGAERALQSGLPTMTSTHTIFNLTAGDADFSLDFFSPVSPKNYTRQSMPYSYLSVSVSAKTRSTIQVLSAIDNTWTAQGTLPRGSLTRLDGISTFDVFNPQEVVYAEHGESQALWGHTVFSARAGSKEDPQASEVFSVCDSADNVYSSFVESGNAQDDDMPVDCNSNALYSHVYQLKDVQEASTVTFAVGLYQEDTINYLNESQTYHFRSKVSSMTSSIAAFFADLSSATTESHALDSLVHRNGDAISSNYTDILEASVRQSFAAVQIIIPSATLSTAPKDVNAFLKEISSDGNVNSVDVLYPTFPIWYVLAPDYIKLTLQPVLAYLIRPETGWTRKEIPHDLGNHYPNATGHDDNKLEVLMGREENMPIQVTSSLISMLLAYVNATGDHHFVNRFVGEKGKYLLTTYVDTLVHDGLYPASQLTTVDALKSVANTTQLAIGAAIGVSAAGVLLNMQNYTEAGARMTQALLSDTDAENNHAKLGAISMSDSAGNRHFTYDYSHPNSWSVMFPLFADKLAAPSLMANNTFVPAYEMQSTFYAEQVAQHPLGLQYSQQAPWGIVDWNFWAAAAAIGTKRGEEVVKGVVDGTWDFLMKGGGDEVNGVPFGTKYDVLGKSVGRWRGNRGRSTVGAVFSLWAMKMGRGGAEW